MKNFSSSLVCLCCC